MNDANTYLKIPIKVYVEFATESGQIDTLEGPVSYQQGDALVTGVRGERWPVSSSRFEQTYEPVEGQLPGRNGSFTKRPIIVTAVQAEKDMTIQMISRDGQLSAHKGDWIVTTHDGAQWVVAADIFPKTYTPLERVKGTQ